MRDHNGSKPNAEWKPPPDYKGALAKARDAQKLKEKEEKDAKAKKGSVSTIGQGEQNDSGSDDNDTYSQYGQHGFSIQALRPYQQVDSGTPWICAQDQPSSRDARIHAITKFEGLNEQQEYDPEVLSASSSWASKVHVKAPKHAKASRTQETDKAAE